MSLPVRNSPKAGCLSWLFRISLSCSLVITAIVVAFFVWGLLDGSITSFNIVLWLALLAVVVAIPAAGWYLGGRGWTVPAILLLSVLVIPCSLYALFILAVLISGASWR